MQFLKRGIFKPAPPAGPPQGTAPAPPGRRQFIAMMAGGCGLAGFTEIKTGRIGESDIVVLRHPGILSRECLESVTAQARQFFKPHQVIILDQGMTLEVIKKP